MKTEFIPKAKTKDKKSGRILTSMTEKEAFDIMNDLLAYRRITGKGETQASWKLILDLKDHFDGQMLLGASAEWEAQ